MVFPVAPFQLILFTQGALLSYTWSYDTEWALAGLGRVISGGPKKPTMSFSLAGLIWHLTNDQMEQLIDQLKSLSYYVVVGLVIHLLTWMINVWSAYWIIIPLLISSPTTSTLQVRLFQWKEIKTRTSGTDTVRVCRVVLVMYLRSIIIRLLWVTLCNTCNTRYRSIVRYHFIKPRLHCAAISLAGIPWCPTNIIITSV